jgi:Phosphodiester glycosidase
MRWSLVFALVGCRDPAPPPEAAKAEPTPVTAAPPAPCARPAPTLPAGVTAERWPMRAKPIAGEACIDVVRIDLARYRLRALSEVPGRTAPAWRDAFHLAAVINAGMFHDTGAPVGLIVEGSDVRGSDNPKMGGFFAWDPTGDGPRVTVAGRDCAGFDLAALRARYRSVVQSYRLLDCDGKAIAWADPKQYSAVAIGVDRAGRVAMIHARGAITMAELSRELADHDLTGALFLEGGPEASLVAGSLALLGSYETGFVENDRNDRWWVLPNVIGAEPR